MTSDARKVVTLEELEAYLHDKGILIDVGGCGCCGSPWFRYADDEVIYGENGVIDRSDLSMFPENAPS